MKFQAVIVLSCSVTCYASSKTISNSFIGNSLPTNKYLNIHLCTFKCLEPGLTSMVPNVIGYLITDCDLFEYAPNRCSDYFYGTFMMHFEARQMWLPFSFIVLKTALNILPKN